MPTIWTSDCFNNPYREINDKANTIIVTSPNGVYKVDTKTEKVNKLFNGNFFGICEDEYTKLIHIAERVSDYTVLHTFENINKKFEKFKLEGVEDVHQIDSYFNQILITNTKKNIVVLFDYKNKEIKSKNPKEYVRNDINHINAILFYRRGIYVGLNNKGEKESQVLNESGDKVTLEGVYHTHDLEPYTQDFYPYSKDILISASHQGFVYSLNKREPLFYTGDVWTRGLAVNREGILVGYSAVSPRSSRQDPSLKNSINLFSHKDFKHIQQIEIPGCGQINDLICIEDK